MLYAVAVGVHFVVNDFGLREHGSRLRSTAPRGMSRPRRGGGAQYVRHLRVGEDLADGREVLAGGLLAPAPGAHAAARSSRTVSSSARQVRGPRLRRP